MGVLKKGTRSLKWASSKKYHAYVKRHGLLQFLSVYQKNKEQQNDEFLWGDEVEHIVTVIKDNQVKLNLRAESVMDQLQELMAKKQKNSGQRSATFHAEYGCFMIETTPSKPYGGLTTDLRLVQRNMTLRRTLIQEHLLPGERVMNISAFPMMGASSSFTEPEVGPVPGPIIRSRYISDQVINSHPRFATLTRNIRRRRGQTVCIRMPLYRDKNTPEFQGLPEQEAHEVKQEEQDEEAAAEKNDPAARPQEQMYAGRPCIHMDAMAFGMGCCCLQTTFQTRSMPESRYLYDQMAVLAPIMLAATAATPFLKGRIADTDARWDVIAQAVDDRTPEELGLPEHLCADHLQDTPQQLELEAAQEEQEEKDRRIRWLARKEARAQELAEGKRPAAEILEEEEEDEDRDVEVPAEFAAEIREEEGPKPRLFKSRYDSISLYVGLGERHRPEYNDVPYGMNPATFDMLTEAGVDPILARHMAHLWVRDPLVIFEDRLFSEKDDESFFHFDNIQSTNWQTVRWKPPPPGHSTGGWKVEFRSMEIQLTDFENAAYTVFIALLGRAILLFDLDLYLPLSKVDENMRTAHKRDAVRTEKFWFRKQVDPKAACCPEELAANQHEAEEAAGAKPEEQQLPEFEEMSMAEIMSGKPGGFPGLIPFVQAYLDVIKCDPKTRALMDRYLRLIAARASGELLTTATFLRECVLKHPDYKQDSFLNEQIVFEVMEMCHRITNGEMEAPQLLGDLVNPAEFQIRNPDSAEGDKEGRFLRGASFRADLRDAQSFQEFRQALFRNQICPEAAAAAAVVSACETIEE